MTESHNQWKGVITILVCILFAKISPLIVLIMPFVKHTQGKGKLYSPIGPD
jgi:hypothetical protein